MSMPWPEDHGEFGLYSNNLIVSGCPFLTMLILASMILSGSNGDSPAGLAAVSAMIPTPSGTNMWLIGRSLNGYCMSALLHSLNPREFARVVGESFPLAAMR